MYLSKLLSKIPKTGIIPAKTIVQMGIGKHIKNNSPQLTNS